MNLLTREPLRTMAAAQAILAACATFLPETVTAAILAVLAVVLGTGVRGQVTPVATAAAVTEHAVRKAAVKTAETITDGAAGGAGEVTPAAQAAINGVVADVLNPLVG